MKKFAMKLLTWVLGSLVTEAILFGVGNRMNGKTLLGKPTRKRIKDIKGDIHIGTDEYEIKDAA